MATLFGNMNNMNNEDNENNDFENDNSFEGLDYYSLLNSDTFNEIIDGLTQLKESGVDLSSLGIPGLSNDTFNPEDLKTSFEDLKKIGGVEALRKFSPEEIVNMSYDDFIEKLIDNILETMDLQNLDFNILGEKIKKDPKKRFYSLVVVDQLQDFVSGNTLFRARVVLNKNKSELTTRPIIINIYIASMEEVIKDIEESFSKDEFNALMNNTEELLKEVYNCVLDMVALCLCQLDDPSIMVTKFESATMCAKLAKFQNQGVFNEEYELFSEELNKRIQKFCNYKFDSKFYYKSETKVFTLNLENFFMEDRGENIYMGIDICDMTPLLNAINDNLDENGNINKENLKKWMQDYYNKDKDKDKDV